MQDILDAIEGRQQVLVRREDHVAPNVHCFPLAVQGDWLLTVELDDFRLDGYTLLRLGDVSSVRNGELERFSERVLQDEGILQRARELEVPLSFSTNRELFHALAKAPWPLVMIDCEEPEEESMLYVGRVIDADDEDVSFRYVDPVGIWDEEEESIPYETITSVRFGDHYTTVLARYIEAFAG